MDETLTQLIMQVPCPRCEAKVGEKCKAVSGKPSTRLHRSRTYPIHRAYNLGYEDGGGVRH